MTGQAGFEKAQDCLVTVTLAESGDIGLSLHSKQERMFGAAIRRCAMERLAELGVEHAKVELSEFGCLDFAIRARIKTAVDRARRAE